jgi:hypothetical protein
MPNEIQLRLKALGLKLGVRKLIAELEEAVIKVGVKAYGPDFRKLWNNPAFTRSGVTFSRSPTGMRAALGDLYEEAWRDRYMDIASRYSNTPATQKWKEGSQGFRPYSDRRFTVSHTRPGKLTGHLEESVAREMLLLKPKGRYLEFTNLGVQGGFKFDPSSGPWPNRRWDVKGGDYIDQTSYVVRFIGFLKMTRVIGEDENLVDFSEANWARIAQVMQGYAQREFVRGVEQFLKSWETKV